MSDYGEKGATNLGRAAEGARPCPVCGAFECRGLYRQRLQGGPLGDSYEVVVCLRCGAAFAQGIPPQEELDRYYAEQSKYVYDHADGVQSPYDFKRFGVIVDQVIPHLPSCSARILDVGCGTGGLISLFKNRGYKNVLGVDPSPSCATSAARLHGVEVRVATLAQLADWKEHFDLVLMVGVLEHLREVRQAVHTISARLKVGGFLYCAQPDVMEFSNCINAPFQQFSIEHVNFFSATSLGRLMAECGFEQRHLWRWITEWREGVTDSVVSGIFARSPLLGTQRLEHHVCEVRPSSVTASTCGSNPGTQSPALAAGAFDSETEAALCRYISKCAEEDRRLQPVIEQLVSSQEPILVWGTGTLTRRLLESTRMADANIVAFVDSNPYAQGRNLAGRITLSPKEIVGRNEAIAICSMTFEREIVRMISEELGLKNRIILLSP